MVCGLEMITALWENAKMQAMVDFAVNDNCWNHYESYWEICIGCGCCSKDKATRYKARYEVCQNMIQDQLSFNGWYDEPELRALQEKNIKLNLKHFRRLSRYYKKKLEELGNG